MRDDSRLIALTDALYRRLLVLYPASFRDEYGTEMAMVFRDAIRAAARRDGAAGVLKVLGATLVDLGVTALTERLEEGFDMSKNAFVRYSGLAGVLGGMVLLLMWYVEFWGGRVEGSLLEPYLPFYALGLTAGTIGLFALTAEDEGINSAGRIGLGLLALSGVMMVLGTGLMVWLAMDIGWTVWMAGLLIHPIGLVLFGIDAMRLNALPRWNATPLSIGTACLLCTIGILLSSWQNRPPYFFLFLLTLGAGWVVLGLILWLSPPQAPVSPGTA